ncbi:MAG: D-tyrosyl-tRNA(Tyr) deacylase [Chloroflexota bacterium]|nr:D-tyrosyl-tRNA(Tyr) deacylase [Chloroflexota bacterium]MDE3101042.1 D-tyrosyl-tRNA(Tyr) deacylase [Chloroflexota bacterium]
MRAVVQRVRSGSVSVDGSPVSAILHGLVVLLGVGAADTSADAERLAAKIDALRIFEDERGKMSHSVVDVGGEVLVVPQFTLYGDVRNGRRPDFTKAAPPDKAQRLFEAFCGALRGADVPVATGRFGAHMRVAIEADGPVTIVASTDGWREGELTATRDTPSAGRSPAPPRA